MILWLDDFIEQNFAVDFLHEYYSCRILLPDIQRTFVDHMRLLFCHVISSFDTRAKLVFFSYCEN